MSKCDKTETTINRARDWLMLVPVTVFACVAAVAFGVGALLKWAGETLLDWCFRPR